MANTCAVMGLIIIVDVSTYRRRTSCAALQKVCENSLLITCVLILVKGSAFWKTSFHRLHLPPGCIYSFWPWTLGQWSSRGRRLNMFASLAFSFLSSSTNDILLKRKIALFESSRSSNRFCHLRQRTLSHTVCAPWLSSILFHQTSHCRFQVH